MLKTLLKLTAKTLTLLCISAVFLFFSTLETRAAVGLSVGHNALNLLQPENLFYGNVGSSSHASSSFLLFQNNGTDRLRVDISGNLTTTGSITANAFSGPLTGQINAANVQSGQFGSNVGNGNFTFPGNVGIGTATPAGRFDVQDGTGTQTAGDLTIDSSGHIVYIGQLDSITGNTTFILRDRLGNIKSIWNNAGSGSIYFGNMGSNYGFKIQTAPITAGSNAVTNGLLEVDGSGRADGIAATFLNANVGIGTTTPGTRLTVVGSGNYSIDAGNYRVGNVATPVSALDAVNKSYLDSAVGTAQNAFWNLSGSNLFASSTTWNVGIGTTNPAQKLDVKGSIISANLSSTTYRNDGIYVWPDRSFGLELGYAGGWGPRLFTRSTSENISFGYQSGAATLQSDYTEWMRIINGNVGIGTKNPGAQLHQVANSVGNIVYHRLQNIDTTNSSSGAGIFIQPTSGGWGSKIWTDRGGTGNAFSLKIGVSSTVDPIATPHLTITAAGNIGIGTTNPTAKLYVNGTSIFNDVATFTQPVIVGAPVLAAHAATKNYVDSQISSSTGAVTFWDGALGGNISNLNSGNVGIGTTNPTYPLEVVGAIRLSNPAQLTISDTAYVKPEGAFIDSDTTRAIRIGIMDNSVVPVGINIFETNNNYTSTYINFRTGNADVLRINNLGNVGIGTTTPATRLTVVGSGNYSIDASNFRVGNVATPVGPLDAVNKSYLDSAVGTAQNAFWNLSGSNLFASSSSWSVGIGTSSPSTKLDVIGGLRTTGPLQLSNVLYMGGGNRVLMVDNAGNVSATSTAPSASTVPVFVGLTASSYNGTSGGNPGYAYANSVCAAAFSGSHVCTTYEMLNTINANSTMPTADAWVHSGPPGYTALANDCDGRRSASSAAYGAYWQMSDSGYAPHGRGLLMTCNNSLQYACCK